MASEINWEEEIKRNPVGKIVFLSALPINILPFNLSDKFEILVIKRDINYIKDLIGNHEVYCYIRHAHTVNLLKKYFSNLIDKSKEEYKLDPRDYIVIFTLTKRTPVSGQDVDVKPEDLLIVDLGIAKRA